MGKKYVPPRKHANFRINFELVNYLDILLLIPLIIGAWRGFKKGLIIELFTLLALLVGIYAGIHFSDFMAAILHDYLGVTSKYLPAISFTVTLLLVGAMVFFAGKLIEKAIKVVALGPVNKFAGMAFGIVKMLFICSATLVMLEAYDEQGDFIPTDLKEGSLLYQPVKKTSMSTIPALKDSRMFMEAGQIASNDL